MDTVLAPDVVWLSGMPLCESKGAAIGPLVIAVLVDVSCADPAVIADGGRSLIFIVIVDRHQTTTVVVPAPILSLSPRHLGSADNESILRFERSGIIRTQRTIRISARDVVP